MTPLGEMADQLKAMAEALEERAEVRGNDAAIVERRWAAHFRVDARTLSLHAMACERGLEV